MEILNEDDIPCRPILSMKEIAEDQSLRTIGTVIEVDHPTRGKYISVGNPLKLSDGPSEATRSLLFSEHPDEILSQVLVSPSQRTELSGALGAPQRQGGPHFLVPGMQRPPAPGGLFRSGMPVSLILLQCSGTIAAMQTSLL
ncbi:hypothetical protein HCN50_05640 [Bradyrhizobium sp. WSM 1744]|uniref:Uncharacterized protein n=1 Tax=Bradyrhizobium archetypum TaxID=2721160 RepID=A0A7Y4H170_9BRAD|nr:hypothetical protein [Bradyrhizobium archetypum]